MCVCVCFFFCSSYLLFHVFCCCVCFCFVCVVSFFLCLCVFVFFCNPVAKPGKASAKPKAKGTGGMAGLLPIRMINRISFTTSGYLQKCRFRVGFPSISPQKGRHPPKQHPAPGGRCYSLGSSEQMICLPSRCRCAPKIGSPPFGFPLVSL